MEVPRLKVILIVIFAWKAVIFCGSVTDVLFIAFSYLTHQTRGGQANVKLVPPLTIPPKLLFALPLADQFTGVKCRKKSQVYGEMALVACYESYDMSHTCSEQNIMYGSLL